MLQARAMTRVTRKIGTHEIAPLLSGPRDVAARTGAAPLRNIPIAGDVVVSLGPAATGNPHQGYAGDEDVRVYPEQRLGHDAPGRTADRVHATRIAVVSGQRVLDHLNDGSCVASTAMLKGSGRSCIPTVLPGGLRENHDETIVVGNRDQARHLAEGPRARTLAVVRGHHDGRLGREPVRRVEEHVHISG
jgi:hypothetical protein